MIFIFTCLHNILQHNIVKGGRGIKERTVNFTFLFQKLVKSYCPHLVFLGQECAYEHMGISGYTGKPLSKPPFSSIREHHQSSGHPISPDDFSILSSCSSSFELLSRESLLISKLKPSLIASLSSVPLTLYN